MAGILRNCCSLAAYAIALLTLHLTPVASAQILSLSQLPYQDPAALDALLLLSENRFAVAIQSEWAQTEKILLRYIEPGVSIDDPSVFFSYVSNACMTTHQVSGCRLYIDFLSWLMKNKRPLTGATSLPQPVLLRPAQLPWQDTAPLNAILLLDASTLASALKSHWGWIKNIINRYLPDHFDLHPISKVFGDIRTTCNSTHSEVACRLHLSDIDGLIDKNFGAPPTLFRTLAQIPYRDPTVLNRLLALTEKEFRAQLANNWTQINNLLNRYINWDIAIAGNIPFAATRLDCQAWMPGDYFMCKNYLNNLAALMHSKRTSASPFRSL